MKESTRAYPAWQHNDQGTANSNRVVKAGIIGGAGYTGGELIRLLLHHPQAALSFVHSRSHAGQPLATVHPDLIGETEMRFAEELTDDVAVLFLCVGHGEAKKFLDANPIAPTVKIIDLSQDFRLHGAGPGERKFVYGLPELQKTAIQTAGNIANPGCFATAIQLGLLPLADQGLLQDEVHTTGITGSTGAGQSLSATTHFSWRANNIGAYKTLTHQHLSEINQSLQQLGAPQPQIHFVPWRGDFTRGIFISSVLHCALPISELKAIYQQYYAEHPFTVLSESDIFLKQVVNTNKCVLQLEKEGNKLVVHSAIDNLLKGASGQAVQNMNLLFGFGETAGLQLKPAAF